MAEGDRNAKAQSNRKFREMLDAELDEIVPIDVDIESVFGIDIGDQIFERKTLTYRHLMVKRLVHQACSGNYKAAQEVLDRLLGKPTQVNENLTITATYEDFLADCVRLDELEASEMKVIEMVPKFDDEDDLLAEMDLL